MILGSFATVFTSCDSKGADISTLPTPETSGQTSQQTSETESESASETTSANTSADTSGALSDSVESTLNTEDEVDSSDTTVSEDVLTVSGDSGTLDLTWSYGLVASSNNSLYKNQITTVMPSHSYTNVISVPKAGTKITFTDDKSSFASKSAYVISSWKLVGGEWELDLDGINYTGSGDSESWIAAPEGETVVYTYITDKANENIRICYNSGQTKTSTPTFPEVTFEVTNEKGTLTQQLEYEASTTAPIPESEYWFEVLEGVKKMNIIGDSYFGSNTPGKQYVWPQLLADKYSFTLDNKGIGGSTMSDSGYKIENNKKVYYNGSNPMVNRFDKMPDNNPDIVLLQGGRNDRNFNVEIGNNTDTTTKTYKGAVNYLITELQKKYPNALLICVTPWKVSFDSDRNDIGKTTYDYARAMVQVCEYRGVVCANAADTNFSKVYMDDPAFRTKYCNSSGDISHLNIEGFKYVMPKFEKFIAEEYAKFLEAKNK